MSRDDLSPADAQFAEIIQAPQAGYLSPVSRPRTTRHAHVALDAAIMMGCRLLESGAPIPLKEIAAFITAVRPIAMPTGAEDNMIAPMSDDEKRAAIRERLAALEAKRSAG